MAVLAPNFVPQFFDNSGNPLALGRLYTYVTGTTTPKATYQNKAGSVSHANPIILDAAGRVQPGLWLDTDAEYRMTLKTSADATVDEWDNVTHSFATLSASSGSASIGFLQEGTGAVARTVQAKLREVSFSVADFGAVGDWDGSTGTSNDTAFAAAFAAAETIMAGGYAVKISIPRGRYRLTQPWDVWRINSPRRDLVIEGEDQLSSILVADWYGAADAIIQCVDPDGVSRSSPLTLRNLGFQWASTSGGVNPLGVDILGHGESKLEGLRFSQSNNTHLRVVSAQNVRFWDVVSFYGGYHFNYKDTSGITFTVDTTANTITASAAIFSAGDVGKFFFVFPADTTRRIRYTISAYTSTTVVSYTGTSELSQTSVEGHFEPARCSMTSGDATLTANASCFAATDVGRVVYVRGARTGAYGAGLLRGTITTYTSPTSVELDVTADITVSNACFAVATVDMGLVDGFAGSSDVKMDALQIEHYDGVALVAQDTDSYQIVQSKIHGETSPDDDHKSLAAVWLDDFGGRFEVELDTTCSMSDGALYVCNQNETVTFDGMRTRGIINLPIVKSELFTDEGGYVVVRGLVSTINFTDPLTAFDDANYAADATDPRIIPFGPVDALGNAVTPRLHVGRGAYFEPTGRFIPHQKIDFTTFAGTIAWAGGTPPSGSTDHSYRWQQLGQRVEFTIRLKYGSAGASNTGVVITLPTSMPEPTLPTGAGANEHAYALAGFISDTATGSPSVTHSFMADNGSGGHKISLSLNSGSSSAIEAIVSGWYWTDA